MSNFTKVDGPLVISNTPGGVFKIEKKRKARDGKDKQQKYMGSDQKSTEEDDSVLVDIDLDRDNDKESEDQMGYGFIKKKKLLYTKVDHKI